MSFTKLEKTDMVFDLWRSPWTFRASLANLRPEKILPNARTFVNVVQHLHDFGRFEMNKRCQRDRILVAEEDSHFNYLYGRIKASSIINYVQMLSLTL
jgi:hypothetical protein